MRTRIFIAAALACAVVLTGCGRRSGEPTRDDLEGAMRAFLKDRNARGGLRLALAARPERTLQFDIELHSLIKRSCTGKDTVWTAGHCVNAGQTNGAWATNWTFVPAYDDDLANPRPWGTWSASQLWTKTAWKNNADFADSANYTSGRLTPAIMIAEFQKNSDSIRQRAIAAGWSASQIL